MKGDKLKLVCLKLERWEMCKKSVSISVFHHSMAHWLQAGHGHYGRDVQSPICTQCQYEPVRPFKALMKCDESVELGVKRCLMISDNQFDLSLCGKQQSRLSSSNNVHIVFDKCSAHDQTTACRLSKSADRLMEVSKPRVISQRKNVAVSYHLQQITCQ